MSRRQRLLEAARHLLPGSAVLLLTLNLANALHFAFHVVMARLLGPADYSAVAALLAILYLLNVLAESAQTVVAREAARDPEPGRLRALLGRALRRAGGLTLLLAAAYALAAWPLARGLRLPLSLVALFALVLVGVGPLPVTRGLLQGAQRFAAYGVNAVAEVIVKLGVGAGLVALGFGAWGAIAGVGLGLVVAFALSFGSLRDLRRVPPAPLAPPAPLGESLPVFVVLASVMGFYSLDVLLARAFFDDALAGQYALASLIGKGILFGTLPIARAMLPLASSAHAARRGSRPLLAATLGLIALCAAPVVAILALWPATVVRLVAGGAYAEAVPLALPLAIAMSLMSASQAILLARLAGGGLRGWALLPLLLPVEAALLALFRNSPASFATAVAGANLLFLLVAAALWAASSGRGAGRMPRTAV